MNRVLITGMGVGSPLGRGLEETWEHLVHGCSTCSSDPGGLAQALKLSQDSSFQALQDANLWNAADGILMDPERIGCTVSVSKPLYDRQAHRWTEPEAINLDIRRRFSLLGENRNVIAACATGAGSVALAALWIEQGLCDVVLAGSVEPYPHELMAAGFKQMGVLSVEETMRPFDQRRSGFVFGEGAGIVVLEAEAHARARGQRPRALLKGWAMGADAHSAVAFNSNGQRIAQVIARALQKASLEPRDIRHVNAHGTATQLNDWIETQALQKAFGSHAQRLMISATKSSTGHLLGAAGSVELILTVLALEHQYIPPTAHLEETDPKCSLDYTPLRGHPASYDHALSLSFGFGGPIGALVVSALPR